MYDERRANIIDPTNRVINKFVDIFFRSINIEYKLKVILSAG